MKTFVKMLLGCCFLLVATSAMGQAIQINAALTPPYSPYFADYENQMILTLKNTTAQVQQVKLIGNIENQETGMYVRTEPAYQPSQPITLQPNEIVTLFANQSSQGFLNKNQIETNADAIDKAKIMASGQIPEGIYDFCVQALDFNTSQPLSGPTGSCQVISIGYPAAPIPTLPSCGAEITDKLPNFMWLPPVGNLANASLRYTFYLTEVPDGTDPNDAMLFALNGNGQNLLVVQNLMTSNYTYLPSDPPLVHDKHYAWAVKVADLNGNVSFQNSGLSIVCDFIWRDPELIGDEEKPLEVTECLGACQLEELNGMKWDDPQLAVNDILKIGDFDMKVIHISGKDAKKRYSGWGLINVPFLNNDKVRVRVQFDTVTLSTDKRVLRGSAKAQWNPGAPSLIPHFNDPQWNGPDVGSARLFALDTWIKDQWAAGKQALYTIWDTYGAEMPMGVSRGGYSVAIMDMRFFPTYAQFDARAVVPLPNFTAQTSALGLGAGSICMSSTELCKGGKFYLTDHFSVDVNTKQAGQELMFMSSTSDVKDTTGTYILFDKDGIKHINVEARYFFPKSVLRRADGNPMKASALLKARTDGVFDWMFMAQIDSFKTATSNDFTFKADSLYFDMSDAVSPPKPDDSILFMEMGDPGWKGFFGRNISTSFATGLTAGHTKIGIKDLIIDADGVSCKIAATNIIDLNKGQVGSFNFTVDTLEAQFFKNGFTKGRLNGGVHINITDADRAANGLFIISAKTKANLIPYTALLTYHYTDILDADGDGDIGEKELRYSFIVKPKPNDTLHIPLWYMTLRLTDNSIIEISNEKLTGAGANQQGEPADGTFRAAALLNGDFGFSVDDMIGVGKIDMVGIKFQNLGLLSFGQHHTSDMQIGLASPQKSIAGFPVSLNDVDFVTKPSKNAGPNGSSTAIGLQFDMNIKIADSIGALPEARTKFSVFGRLDPNAQGGITPAFDHASLDEICIKGQLSVVKFDGCVSFYDKDPTYGNGFRGNVKVEFPSMGELGAAVQFGSVNNYKYWYADAFYKAGAGKGLPLFAGVEAYGLGGGAYYHMKRSDAAQPFTMDNTPLSTASVGMTPTGVSYVPDKTYNFGFKAKVFLGLIANRDVFNGDVALEMTIVNGGLGQINLDGNARFMSENQMEGGAVTGLFKAKYDHPQKTFSGAVQANLSIGGGILTANGGLDMYFAKNAMTNNQLKWYTRFGRPTGYGTPIGINIAGFVKVETYFEMGNFQIDPMPAPPAFIANLAGVTAAKNSVGVNRNNMKSEFDGASKLSILHGGLTGMDVDKEFLIFYGKLKFGLGYDLMVQQLDGGCAGFPTAGLNGWYFKGQAYAGALGEIGLNLELFGTKARYTIASVGVGAVLQAGFMNPTWAEGSLGGQYELFDGWVSGNFHYEFTVGEKCVTPEKDVLKDLKIIADISPSTGSNNEPVTVTPSVATNLQMNGSKMIHLIQSTGNGNETHRLFRFDDDLVKVEFKKGSQVIGDTFFKRVLSSDNYGIMFRPNTTLEKLTNYQFKVTATVQECQNVSYNAATKVASCNGNVWKTAKYNGQDWKEEKIITFKTDNGLKRINEDMVEFTFPYQGQREFMHRHLYNGKARIKMDQGFNMASYNFPAGATDIKFTARFVPLSTSDAAVNVPAQVTQGSNVVIIDYPANLLKSTYYSVQLVARWQKQNSGGNGNPQNTGSFTAFQNVSTMTYKSITFATLKQRELMNAKLDVPENAVVFYEFRFRTSQFTNLEIKTFALKTSKAIYNVRTQSGGIQNVALDDDDLTNANTIVAAINQKMGNAASFKPTIRYMPEVAQKGPEAFDTFDIYGYRKVMKSGIVIKHEPLVEHEKPEISNFHYHLTQKLLQTLYGQQKAKKDMTLTQQQGYFTYDMTAPFYGRRIGWDEANNTFGQIWVNVPTVLALKTSWKHAPLPPAANNDDYLDLVEERAELWNWGYKPMNGSDTYQKYLQRMGQAWDIVNQAWNNMNVLPSGGIVIGGNAQGSGTPGGGGN
jgi:hypothetical protein